MDKILLKMPVTIKAKLTEKLRAKLSKELEDGIAQANLEIQQIDIQAKRAIQENTKQEMSPADFQRLDAIRQQFGQEREKRMQYVAQATKRKEDLEKLAIGAEIVQGTLERTAEVHVGDNMRELMNVEVLVEDDKIIAIRG